MSDITRRDFVKIAGISIVGLITNPMSGLLAADSVPFQSPLKAKRWGLAIDLRKCQDVKNCTRCIDACHRVHNVPHHENPKDKIHWIWKESFEAVFSEQDHEFLGMELRDTHPIVACNHCENPPCVKVCPTQSTWKREEDGIVMMDWHRCIGCRYCIAACPYGSRSFNWRDPKPHIPKIDPEFPARTRGVVEKCNFCEERLARGLPMACVEACDAGAMIFGDIEQPDSDLRRVLQSRFSIRRKASLGTQPSIYYLV